MSHQNKTAQLLDALKAGKIKPALRIAKSFTKYFTKNEKRSISRGYECLVHPDIYRQLGLDPDACVAQALKALQDHYASRL